MERWYETSRTAPKERILSRKAWASPREIPELGSQCVQVWRFDLQDGRRSRLLAFADRVMSSSERERSRQLLTVRGSETYRCGRGLLRMLLGRAMGVAAEDLCILLSGNGKPEVAGEVGFRFSISHSSSTLLVALCSAGEVGVDVEDRATSAIRGEDLNRLAQELFPPEEAGLVHSAGSYEEQLCRFLFVWTMREAVGKAAGVGILTRGRIGPVLPGVNPTLTGAWWDGTGADGERGSYRVMPINGIDGSIASLALKEDVKSVCRLRAEALFDDGGSGA